MYEILRYVHALALIAAVASACVPALVLLAVTRQGDVGAMRGVAPFALSARALAAPLIVLAAITGFAAALIGRVDPLRPWLIAAYAAFIVALVAGALLVDPWARAIGAAAEVSPSGSASPALRTALRDRRGPIGTAILVLSVAVIIFMGVNRPGG